MTHISDHDSGPSRFRTTVWTIVAHAQDKSAPDYEASLEFLCKRYWKPIYNYCRRRGKGAEEARDLTQEYFATFLEKGFVESADRERGKFRTFLLTTLSRFLSKQYRKEKRRPRRVPLQIPLPGDEELPRPELAAEETPEDAFNRSWAHSLIDRSLQRMREECTEEKPRLYCQVFCAHLDSATSVEPKTYREIGCELNLTETDVTNYLHRGRNIFHKILREEIRQSVLTESEVDEEIQELQHYFA